MTSYANLLVNLQPDGTADQQIIADPRTLNVSLSGEARVTHSIVDGPRLHVIHVSLRERDARREYGGSDEVDRGFVEKTSAAIIVLLLFMLVMNGLAIFLRNRFERRW